MNLFSALTTPKRQGTEELDSSGKDTDYSGLRSESGSEYDEHVDPVLQRILWKVRSQEVREHVLRADKAHYSQQHDVRLQALTYNVNGRRPPAGMSLAGWLEPGDGDFAADVVAVGFQELVPLNAGNVLSGGEAPEVAKAWTGLVEATLNRRCPGKGAAEEAAAGEGRYVLLVKRQLVGVFVAVWVRASLRQHIRGVQVATVATGFGGLLANKGAVGVRFRAYDTGICLLCAHFASGESSVANLRRLQDFSDTVQRLEFPPAEADDAPHLSHQPVTSLVVGPTADGDWGGWRSLLAPCHHHIFLMGDLNFRVSMPHGQALQMVRGNRLGELVREDGLTKALRSEPLLRGWKEGELLFPPTYKFKPGSEEYVGEVAGRPTAGGLSSDPVDEDNPEADDEREDKLRTPSWTDRVLWRSGSGAPSRQLAYTCGGQTLSDHRPVAAAFLLSAREYSLDAVSQLVEEGWHELDMAEMSAMPRCDLDPKFVDFGTIGFDDPHCEPIVLRNTGSVPAHFRFVDAGAGPSGGGLQPASVKPPWLEVDPLEGVIEEGAEIDIRLSVEIRGGAGGCAEHVSLELGGQLEQILILHIAGGSDFFVSVTGRYAGSCFGLPLGAISRKAGGRPPAAVTCLTEFLLASCGAAEAAALFGSDLGVKRGGDLSHLRHLTVLREAASQGGPIPEGTDPRDALAVLLQLFAELPAPMMPEAATQVCSICVPKAPAAANLLREALSEVEIATFQCVTDFARQILPTEGSQGDSAADSVCSALADVWFPPMFAENGVEGAPSEFLTELDDVSVAKQRSDFIRLFVSGKGKCCELLQPSDAAMSACNK